MPYALHIQLVSIESFRVTCLFDIISKPHECSEEWVTPVKAFLQGRLFVLMNQVNESD